MLLSRKLKLIKNLFLVGDIIKAFGHYKDFKIHEEFLNVDSSYEDIEKVKNILKFISEGEPDLTPILKNQEEKNNDLIDLYVKYNESKTKLDLNDVQIKKLFDKLETNVFLNLPNYYLSIPNNCGALILYIRKEFNKKELIDNFITLNLSGKHTTMDKRIFYNIYTLTLNSYNEVKN